MPSAKTPTVCVAVTIRPRSAAWRGVPRWPTRYAVTIVFPCPGESACAAPQKSGAATGLEPSVRGGDVEWALEEVLGVGAELVARAGGGRADDDFLPPDAVAIVVVLVGNRDPRAQSRPCEDHLQPGRVEAAGAHRMCQRRSHRPEPRQATVDRELRVLRDATRVGVRVDAAGLEGWDLGHVEDVADVQPRARDLDPAEAVDREVAQR